VVTGILLFRWPRAGFLAAWFVITLAPTSSILPIAAEVGADRRMYVPLMGLVALGVCAIAFVLDRAQSRPHDSTKNRPALAPVPITGMLVLFVAVIALGARTIMRNVDYSSELRLSRSTLEHWPSPIAHDMVGLSLAAAGRLDMAIDELRQAVDGYAPARYDLGVQYYKQERFDEAIDELRRFVTLEPHLFTTSAAYTLIGGALDRRHRPLEAIDAYRLAVSGAVPDLQAHGYLADLLLDQQKYSDAVDHYRAYLKMYPGQMAAMMNLGIALESLKRTDEALDAFRRAVQMDPTNVQARMNLAQMLLEAGQPDAAIAEAQQVVGLAPTSAPAFDFLGQALATAQRVPDARRAFERALAIDPGYTPAKEHLKILR
jgi:tetratricopeptide (TPR) repeat protein